MNNQFIKRFFAFFIVFQLLLSTFGSYDAYAKDKMAPNIKCHVYTDVNNGKLKLKITVTDNSAVKAIKYAVGNHRKSFFGSAYYSKKVKNVSVDSTKNISTAITVQQNDIYTVYAVDKSGNSSIKKVRIKMNTNNNQTNPNTKDNTDNSKNTGKNTANGNNAGNNTSNNNGGNNSTADSTQNVNKNVAVGTNEVRAAWITFLEFNSKGYTLNSFNSRITEMFDRIAASGLNEIYVHVRPFSDAMYRSAYFPWSKYASGTQGVDPGFDPLAIMVNAAHSRNLKIHAYINPYRVCTEADFGKLATSSPAYKWLNDDDEDNDRNVLKFGNMYYYNPSSDDVIKLINNGVAEIVKNYDVDGIIFDDYFYPTLGSNYASKFDSDEYNDYKSNTSNPLSIADWRRNNINKMVKMVYATVKKSGKNRTFGISPAGNLNNLRANDKYYVDIDRWGRESGYVDYIAPQLYWGFEHNICPYEQTINNWIATVINPNVKLYIALPMHLAQAQETSEWKNNHDILGRMVTSLRNKSLTGFSVYRYDYMTPAFLRKTGAIDEYNYLVKVIKSK